MKRDRRVVFALPTALCLLTGLLVAGSLDPAAPPAPTMKTLDAVEPRTPISEPLTITSPGSYYLTGPLEVLGNDFRIATDNVTLDLNGFTLTGSSNYGLVLDDGTENVVVENGGIHGFLFGGVLLRDVANVRLRNLSIRGNGDGISSLIGVGEALRDLFIENCTIIENVDRGVFGSLRTGSSVYVMNNVISRNGDDGLYLAGTGTFHGSVSGNRCFANGGTGIWTNTAVTDALEFTKNVCGDNSGGDYLLVPNVSGSAGAGAWDNISLP